jgi:transcription antitermination factor NusG
MSNAIFDSFHHRALAEKVRRQKNQKRKKKKKKKLLPVYIYIYIYISQTKQHGSEE